MKITFISDTHNKHNHLTSNAYNNILGSGDVLVQVWARVMKLQTS
jgi:calcineurin-like phosphoesterase family protein